MAKKLKTKSEDAFETEPARKISACATEAKHYVLVKDGHFYCCPECADCIGGVAGFVGKDAVEACYMSGINVLRVHDQVGGSIRPVFVWDYDTVLVFSAVDIEQMEKKFGVAIPVTSLEDDGKIKFGAA